MLNTHGIELREQRVRADRPDHVHRPRREERDPDRRVREDADGFGHGSHRGGTALGQAALPAHPDDGLRLHPGRRSPADRGGRRRRVAQGDRHGRLRRHAHRDHSRGLPGPDVVRGGREADRRGQARGTPRRHGTRRSSRRGALTWLDSA